MPLKICVPLQYPCFRSGCRCLSAHGDTLFVAAPSHQCMELAMGRRSILLVAQKSAAKDSARGMYSLAASQHSADAEAPDGTVKVWSRASARQDFFHRDERTHFVASAEALPPTRAIPRKWKQCGARWSRIRPVCEAQQEIRRRSDLHRRNRGSRTLADTVAATFLSSSSKKQKVLR